MCKIAIVNIEVVFEMDVSTDHSKELSPVKEKLPDLCHANILTYQPYSEPSDIFMFFSELKNSILM